MRTELELIQRIEEYLSGTMPETEIISFESDMHANPELFEQVQLQKQLMKGIQRSVWRGDAVKAYARYSSIQSAIKWGFIATSIVTITGLVYVMYQNRGNDVKHSEPASVAISATDTIRQDTSTIYNVLEGNSFVIDSSRDTIVKTKAGLLVEIPKELFGDTIYKTTGDTLPIKMETSGSHAKIYTLHFYTPSYKDSLKKWKQSVQDKNYAQALRSFVSSANPKNYFKTSSKNHEIKVGHAPSDQPDTVYKAAIGLNMEKINNDFQSKNPKLYKLKGKIPFVNKSTASKNTILVFDVDNSNKSSIDTAIVIEIVDQLKSKSLISKPNKK